MAVTLIDPCPAGRESLSGGALATCLSYLEPEPRSDAVVLNSNGIAVVPVSLGLAGRGGNTVSSRSTFASVLFAPIPVLVA
jgi:hypothetical protein